ncbi:MULTISPECIES: efflux RND transporter periplasmic adaptor subunit [unclassified Oceanispirochaeta]|uniref:efflux RND transporter periplasmic adaptor subunit n=1 Tax=unclassified Oceanispirochaeta TaxID=2635722 RepID=UPI000E091425|nr:MULTISPECIES: efflux RND transporter periplasmic adaptor subunit [unclassified Oceanispirochaeta]MBF9016291.1 efflux RND transporter periplasmic adaptor subunit [Oceanispirochaeta sp. M2]NPD72754.1 efflux RND transporter periplasmic adaptor subunit [Oceanispirochaeta sp. M1]RDG31600.1 efflux RND transporter periplasmic adaptor subunit [Oceanispirochaeta sp. M1]
MAKMTKGMSVIVLILILSAIGLFFLNNRRQKEDLKMMPAPVVLQKPVMGTLSRNIRLTGITESRSTVTVLPRINGLLNKITVSMGDEVKTGQVLALVDDEVYRLTLNQAQAALSGAEATYKRIETLYKSNSAPPQSYDEALASYEAARAQFSMAALHLKWCEIRSPIDGTVLDTHREEGALISPEVPLLTIADLNNPELNIDVPEEYYGRFRDHGLSMHIVTRIPALENEEFSSRVRQVAPWIAPKSKTFQLQLDVDDPEKLIRPGMFAAVLIELELLEETAILEWKTLDADGGLWYLDNDNLPRRMEYEPLIQGEEGFQAPEGMEDLSFILEGQHFLTEGHELRILEK